MMLVRVHALLSSLTSVAVRSPRVVAALLALTAIGSGACGEDASVLVDPGGDGTVVKGIVVQTGTQVLLSGVTVTLAGRTVESDDRGRYRFEEVRVGAATLLASLPGYLPYQRGVEVEEGVNEIDIPLIPDD